ncbi:MAG: type II toxin-antitoxin system HicA family toxin [Caulobacteraceae bacterium]
MAALLRAAGFQLEKGGKGSHEKWRHPGRGVTVTVPRTKNRHTANKVLKQAGLPKAF